MTRFYDKLELEEFHAFPRRELKQELTRIVAKYEIIFPLGTEPVGDELQHISVDDVIHSPPYELTGVNGRVRLTNEELQIYLELRERILARVLAVITPKEPS